jgi:hypothetical protein
MAWVDGMARRPINDKLGQVMAEGLLGQLLA